MVKPCPVCGVELKPRVVYGIEVDFCPRCGGVWLDGGELGKLIAKIREYEAEQERPAYYEGGGEHEAGYAHGRRGKKRRGIFGFLEDLFEFD